MSAPIFLTFVYALFKSYEPVKGLGTVYQQFELAFGATAKVFEYIGNAEEPAAEPGLPALPPFSRNVEFDRVGFGYDPDLPILREISFEARAGEVIAIVGSSGAGKTTLVNLLPRFYPVTSGSLRIDGVDVREVTLRSLREQMAIVTQETILFNDTVWNNICYGRPGLPKDRVEAAAQGGAGARIHYGIAAGLPDHAWATAGSASAADNGSESPLPARSSKIRPS